MEPIHHSALDGDVAAIDRLVEEDGERLNAQIQGDDEEMDCELVAGCSPLMLAASWGHEPVVARLLALGGDVELKDSYRDTAAHWACYEGDHSSVLALLLDAGAPINARNDKGRTPFMEAASCGGTRCMALLMDRGGGALDLNAKDRNRRTALHLATSQGHHQAVSLLLDAGADPTIHCITGSMPLGEARLYQHPPCVDLLDAALVEPQRSRALFKVRALIATRRTVAATAAALASKGLPAVLHQGIAAMAGPPHLAERVAQAQELPRVSIQHNDSDEEELRAASVKYALGLEGGGGVVLFKGQEPAVGMLPEVLMELLELLVPKWDPAHKGRPLGEGV